ncbi:MAG: hypothetical protein LBH85_04615, partial [Treponema sp.]|nr:hypothetical protein [Treponema sp.]
MPDIIFLCFGRQQPYKHISPDKRQATSDKRQATRDKRQATSDKRQATSDYDAESRFVKYLTPKHALFVQNFFK